MGTVPSRSLAQFNCLGVHGQQIEFNITRWKLELDRTVKNETAATLTVFNPNDNVLHCQKTNCHWQLFLRRDKRHRQAWKER